jgi:hypothetical protein
MLPCRSDHLATNAVSASSWHEDAMDALHIGTIRKAPLYPYTLDEIKKSILTTEEVRKKAKHHDQYFQKEIRKHTT